MSNLTSFDNSAPVFNPVLQKMFLYHDPLGIGDRRKYEFELEVFTTYEESAFFRIIANDRIMKTGSEYNDYYGPGTSVTDPVEQAEQFLEDIGDISGTTIKAQVVVVIQERAVFQSNDKPFYHGSVRMSHVPGSWWLQGTTSYDEQPRLERKELVVWENGKWTDAAYTLGDELRRYHNADVMGDKRNNGGLRPLKPFPWDE